ncbi:MAG: NAD-dependent deacetylase [Deltaproteobacteria bacterium]|nr:NAD-dependent deacetylase [Deltaproteobacteria bacterium]
MTDTAQIVELLRGRRVAVLTGAGCSTESGIPDYRGLDTPPRSRPPIQHREFVDKPDARRRYWARSLLGWPRLAHARPNAGHAALARLERVGCVTGLITQNVDGLHGAAGSHHVVELHGAIARVRCLACGELTSRAALQERLLDANPAWRAVAAPSGATAGDLIGRADANAGIVPGDLIGRSDENAGITPGDLIGRSDANAGLIGRAEDSDPIAGIAPDGDADLPDRLIADFRIVPCAACDGTLMPDVVFFGGSVPRATLDAAWRAFDDGEVLLVVGSSLAVFSGYRFVRRAHERGIPIAILNRGPTRGDPHATLRVDARAGDALAEIADRLA